MWQDVWLGGRSDTKTVGEWCQSVSRSPVVIENAEMATIAELLDDETSKAAVTFAIMDKWVCHGGFYYRLDRETPDQPGSCWCPEDDDFELDDHCMPVRKKCKGEPLCHVPKILVEYTRNYQDLNDYGMEWRVASRRVSIARAVYFYKPIPDESFEICGTVACQWKNFPPVPPDRMVVTIHKDTSQEVARYVEGAQDLPYPRAQMYQPYGCHRDDYKKTALCSKISLKGILLGTLINPLYPWRPRCPEGFSQISDFAIDYGSSDWIRSKAFFGENVRGCFLNKCLKKCFGEWIWDAGIDRHSMMITRIAGGEDKFGSDVHSTPGVCGFFTTTQNRYTPPKQTELLCLDPACTRVPYYI